jgi:ribosomal protein L11 methyltransferase
MLDLGTGTGILAIAGAFLGARKVLAVDISPTAVEVAEQNVRDNNVTEIVEVSEGTIRSVENKYDLVTANLTGGLLEYISRDLANSLAEGGTLIVSGIMDDDRDRVLEAFTESDLSLSDELNEGEWVALSFGKQSLVSGL